MFSQEMKFDTKIKVMGQMPAWKVRRTVKGHVLRQNVRLRAIGTTLAMCIAGGVAHAADAPSSSVMTPDSGPAPSSSSTNQPNFSANLGSVISKSIPRKNMIGQLKERIHQSMHPTSTKNLSSEMASSANQTTNSSPSVTVNNADSMMASSGATGQANSASQVSAPPYYASAEEEAESQAAFSQLLKKKFPLTPNQVKQFKKRVDEQERAAATPANTPPAQGVSSIIAASLKPGAAAPIIRVGYGMISSVVLTDAKGKVWPIVSYSLGDTKSFNVQWDKSSGVLMVQGLRPYAESNMGIMLKGLNVPVMVTLMTGQNQWDYLSYVRVQAVVGFSKEQMDAEPVSQAPSYLISILNGTPPAGSQMLKTSKSDVQVWAYQGNYLVLTRATLMSPAWSSRADSSGPNELHAYEVPVAPYLLVSDQGDVVKVKVDDQSDGV